ncbi:autotransporter assembly complex protein TamA [Cellvibrio fontiphilus]|uniref:Translocation and assembly module subunit TamA n=1 Tax=Cellvibrio fontiphilus TaxID=1815559 RepID=A0ABV7FGP1_9GAMM
MKIPGLLSLPPSKLFSGGFLHLWRAACAPLSSLLLLSLLLVVLPAGAARAAEPEIDIEGGTKALRDNIRLHLSLAEESCSSPLWRLNSLLNDSEAQIKAAAQALGFYELEYEAKLVRNKDCWGLNIQLTPGEPILVTELRIEILGEGSNDPIFKPLYDKPGIKLGNRLNHGRYETLKARFATLASLHGYFDAEFVQSQIAINVGQKSAAIALVYDTGKRYRIGAISLKHGILDQDFLERYYTFRSGDYYDTDELLELKNLYNASNYFAVASVAPDLRALDGQQVPINIELEERKRRAYSLGAGIENDEPRLLLGFEDRYLNRRGHRFDADLALAENKTAALATYTIPLRRPAYEFLRFYTGYDKEDTVTSLSKKYTYGSSYTYYQDNKWLQTYALDYVQEESVIGRMAPINTNLIIPSVSFLRTQTDGAPYPLSGWSALGRISGSPKSIGSDFSFAQFYGRAKYVKGFSYGRLLLRAELGLTETDNVDQLPASVRFFAGGDASVRGYEYKSLGPTRNIYGKDFVGPLEDPAAAEEVIGGNNLLVTSIEYDYRFEDSNWVAALFYDQGNAADDTNIDFKRSAGLGVRWISPIGPIRIDLARALDDEKSWMWHISMGPDL